MVVWWAVSTLRGEFLAKEGVAVLHQIFGPATAGGNQPGNLIFAEANWSRGQTGSDESPHHLR